MSSIFELEDALVEFVAQNTFDIDFLRSNEQSVGTTAPKVWAGFIPRDQVGAIIPGEITTYPCIVLCARRGLQSIESEIIEVELVVGCFDDTRDQQGYRDVVNVVQRLKDRFRESDFIRERYPLRMPLKWEINRFYGGASSNYYPYFFGDMTISFEVEVMMTQYDVTYADGAETPGRFNQFPIPNTPPEPPPEPG